MERSKTYAASSANPNGTITAMMVMTFVVVIGLSLEGTLLS